MTVPAAAGHAPDLLRLPVAVGFASFFPLAVASPAAAGIVFWLLAIVGAAVWVRMHPLPSIVQRRAALLVAALMPVGLNLASKLVYGLPWRVVSWTPFLALPMLVMLARAAALDLRTLLAGAVLGGFGAAAVALYGRLELGAERADWTLNAILFGQAALVYAAIALLAWRWRLPFRWPALLPAAVLAALVAFALSGSRGGLLALPLVVVALLGRAPRAAPAAHRPAAGPADRRGVRRRAWRAAGAAAVVMLVALAVLRSPMAQRFAAIDDEVAGYEQGRIAHSSVGSRLAMWRAAATLTWEHPLFGVGAQQFQQGLAGLRAQGRFPQDVDLFRHAHNTYLTVAAEYGLIGVAAWAATLAALWRLLGHADPPARRIGRCVLGCWLAFALTNDILAHQTTLRLLVLLAAGCIGAVARIAPSENVCTTTPR